MVLHDGALGALLTFSATPCYPAYHASTTAWGLAPLEDQQLGGPLMWIPAGLVYLFADLALIEGDVMAVTEGEAKSVSK